MKWTVAWVDNSENELAVFWMNAEDPDAITRVSHEIE